jgi:hypothetical protein
VRTAIEDHVGEEFGLVNLTSVGAGDSDSDWHFFFNQIRQVVVGAITRGGLLTQIPGFVRPGYASIDEEEVHFVLFRVSDLGKLETPCCRFIVVLIQDKQKISHASSPHLCSRQS